MKGINKKNLYHLSCEYGKIPMIKFLEYKGFDPKQYDFYPKLKNKHNGYWYAYMRNKTKVLKNVMEKYLRYLCHYLQLDHAINIFF